MLVKWRYRYTLYMPLSNKYFIKRIDFIWLWNGGNGGSDDADDDSTSAEGEEDDGNSEIPVRKFQYHQHINTNNIS